MFIRHLVIALAIGTLPLGCESGMQPVGVSSAALEGRVFVGNFRVQSKADVGRLGGYNRITGDVLIEPYEELTGIELDKLQVIDGSLQIKEVHGRPNWPFVARQLTKVGLNIEVISASSQVSLELPKLDFVGGHIDLSFSLVSFSAPVARSVNGDVRVRDIVFKGKGFDVHGLERINGSVRMTRYSADFDDAEDFLAKFSLPNLTEVVGDIRITEGSETQLTLTSLSSIGGDLDVSDIRLGLNLPELSWVGGDIRQRAVRYTGFDLSSLSGVGGAIEIESSQLETDGVIDLSSLRSFPHPDGIAIAGIGNLTEVRFGATFDDTVSRVRITDNPNLGLIQLGGIQNIHSALEVQRNGPVQVEAGALTQVGDMRLTDNTGTAAYFKTLELVYGNVEISRTKIAALVLPAVEEIGGNLTLHGLSMSESSTDTSLPGLRYIRGSLEYSYVCGIDVMTFGALEQIGTWFQGTTVGNLSAYGNCDLNTISLPALASVAHDILVRDNQNLDPATITLALQAVQNGGERLICQNGEYDEPPCP